MDGDNDDYRVDDHAFIDEPLDDDLSVVSFEGDEAEARDAQISNENDSYEAIQRNDRANIVSESSSQEIDNHHINDHAHYRNMIWNNSTYQFEYTRDHDEPEDSIPNLTQWKKIRPREMKRIKVTFNQGRNTMVGHYVAEYDAILKRLEHLRVEKTTKGVFDYLFGNESKLTEVMMRRLDLSFEECSQFLATTYFAAELGATPKHLENHRSIKYDGYMKTDRLNEIWKAISVVGKTGSEEKLWLEIQEALNKDLKDLFLAEGFRPDVMRVALDDDKVHFHMATSSIRNDGEYLVGMKACQHVKSNVRGFTIDSAVSSATGFPLNFSVLRQGESNTDNYERMLKCMFSHRFSRVETMNSALNGIIFCSDRGYWVAPLISLILCLGGVVFGTLKRAWWVPFTYDQTKPNGREIIQGKYGRSCFLAFSRWKRNMLKVMAWRSGTGSVALAMNSDNFGDTEPATMDFCFKKYGDGKWYKSSTITQGERNLKAFQREIEIPKHSEETAQQIRDHLLEITSTKVKMLTVSDLDFSWFTLRMFSLTSSSA
jgi:hypothetical protein